MWAVRVAKSRGVNSKYTYGWQRAEILGALINSVFLLALCLTIFLEAIQRFITVPEITNPKLILVVGIAGLVSNLVGLVLFHEHGHSHGGDGAHSHSHVGNLEEGTNGHTHSHGGVTAAVVEAEAEQWDRSRRISSQQTITDRVIDDHTITPGTLKHVDETSGLLDEHQNTYSCIETPEPITHSPIIDDPRNRRASVSSVSHIGHFHVKPKVHKPQKSMNMEGVFLHVMGDALGNVGVIITALFIWKTEYSWKYYMDPVTSLVITAIIFSSALPLCRRTSAILLQGVPQSVDADEVRDDIGSLPGVIGIHDLHIWILSETINVATLHVSVSGGPAEFMKLAQRIRTCMRGHGIASTTIQPEFEIESSSESSQASSSSHEQPHDTAGGGSEWPPACVLQGNKSSGGLYKINV